MLINPFSYTSSSSLPESWQSNINKVFAVQNAILIIHCIAFARSTKHGACEPTSRWLPCTPGPIRNWVFWQYEAMLWGHIIYFAAELALTSMIEKYTIVATHHVLAICVCAGLLLEPNAVSVLTAAPFLVHNTFWALNNHSYALLFVYNCALLAAGTFVNATLAALPARESPWRSPTARVLLLAILPLCFNNYFMYCYYMSGSACVQYDPLDALLAPAYAVKYPSGLGPYRGPLAWTLVFSAVWLALIHTLAAKYRRRCALHPPVVALVASRDGGEAVLLLPVNNAAQEA
ncbi:hypothetical protein HDU83_005999 [Entophlyctis luteolus]|nr:hypothetical protein HDU83_005999 [Entophlyctis luteolus]KAJ3392120.1 hypothetical protein HDU84_004829 [Entophlyctis sp. JEL0112]